MNSLVEKVTIVSVATHKQLTFPGISRCSPPTRTSGSRSPLDAYRVVDSKYFKLESQVHGIERSNARDQAGSKQFLRR